MLSFAEENYLKTIYHLSENGANSVSTNAIAETLNTKPASVSDMIRKLDKKGVVTYVKYQGVNISSEGRTYALKIIRKHRLWEVFLVNKLRFNWDQVHEVAEQLEHIQSPLLIERLDDFLGKPKFDPHGDPIPDEHGNFASVEKHPLSESNIDSTVVIRGVQDTSSIFLKYLDKLNIKIGTQITINDKIPFDGSMEITLDGHREVSISKEVANNLMVS
ncbi:metal-dependent transcriptional regulator [Aureibacter tunicatorum]|uniref:Transcriptional regulator MntR n=1 Tax=Aureibacter tunicatorum TaxID=866807 RepID=A0AAE3XJX0_9BACT|nr:metal-dependent transcriptional regulator [Aureibacter tunicatorum]MDR6239136.1 DtxR family Mn-dependent transcriptional regulator [Aureibacter tunicatorum]BDD04938.1 iron-dependent repressor [Aureibacter tunicatorum]